MKNISISCLALAALLVPASFLSAAVITYEGTLSNGSSFGAVAPGNNETNPILWDFWQFNASASDHVVIEVRRLNGGLDPAAGIWFGLGNSNTDDFSRIFDDSFFSALIEFGDDELPPNLPGSFGDPLLDFIAPSTGTYTLAVTSYVSSTSDVPFSYRIDVSGVENVAVPEPASLALWGVGSLGCALAGYRRRKAV